MEGRMVAAVAAVARSTAHPSSEREAGGAGQRKAPDRGGYRAQRVGRARRPTSGGLYSALSGSRLCNSFRRLAAMPAAGPPVLAASDMVRCGFCCWVAREALAQKHIDRSQTRK